MLKETDLKQIWNLVISFYKKKKYFPFVEDLMKEYELFFPQDLSDEDKNQIDDYVNQIIIDTISEKWTKWSAIMLKILKNNEKEWKEFRKLNSSRFFYEKRFKELWKKIEILIMQWEDRLTEKLVWHRSMWIQKASDAWFDMVYAIFPEWNKI